MKQIMPEDFVNLYRLLGKLEGRAYIICDERLDLIISEIIDLIDNLYEGKKNEKSKKS